MEIELNVLQWMYTEADRGLMETAPVQDYGMILQTAHGGEL